MKKRMIKKGWPLGLLIALVMLVVGADTAAANFVFVDDLCGNTSSDMYYYSQANKFYINGTFIDEYDRFEASGFTSTKGTGSTYSSVGDWSGNWNSNSENIQFFIVKGGNCNNGKGYIALYGWDGSGSQTTGSFDLTSVANYSSIGNLSGVSHVDLYSTSSVPIPGAVWLLSSGLGLLFIRRRRQRI